MGVVDCLRDGENGLLTPPGDVPALAGSLRHLLRDRAERLRLADAGLRECREKYAWGPVGRQIMQVYDRVTDAAVDHAWPMELPMTPCRYRAQPHLL